jgi:hypothetical protein
MDFLRKAMNAPETLKEARNKETAFTRKRLMPFASALGYMLDKRKTTLQTRLNIHFKQNGGGNPISQQAFSKLRMKFNHSPFEKMVRGAVQREYSGQYELPLWHGYHVFGVDGSYLQLPRADDLYETFGIHGRPPNVQTPGYLCCLTYYTAG